jgi:quercetin dioxygenase-like cupin family protein
MKVGKMKRCSENFLFGREIEKETVADGMVRQIMGHNDDLMLVRVRFAEGAVGYTHAHPHSQIAYVESGVFDFTIGEETRTLKTGDCAYVPPDMQHGAVCREAGVLLDIFSPAREDFLEG